MKLFGNWLGFVAIATGAAHFIFAVASNSIATDKSPPDKDTSGKGRASYIWEKRVTPPYPYQQQYHAYKTIVTPVQSSNKFSGERVQSQHRIGPEYLKSDFRPTVTSQLPVVSGGQRLLEREEISPKKSYGYSGGSSHSHDHHHGGGGGGHYYAAQPLPYYPATKEHSFGIGSFGFFKPLFLLLILPFFLLIFFVAVVYVVRIAAASSSTTAAVALSQQQQQQQDSNNNNNNNNNDNNNNNNAIVLASSTGTFVITINATGRAQNNNFLDLLRSPAPLFNWHNSHHHTTPSPMTMMNETWLLA